MTCIVGLVDWRGAVWMGGDRCWSNNGRIGVDPNPKIVRVGNLLAGSAGDAGIGDLFLLPTVPAFTPDKNLRLWVIADLVPWLFIQARERGLLFSKEGATYLFDGDMLIGGSGILVRIGSGASVTEYADHEAIGNSSTARGVLWATGAGWPGPPGARPDSHTRIRLALEASETLCEGVRGPFDILSIPKSAP